MRTFSLPLFGFFFVGCEPTSSTEVDPDKSDTPEAALDASPIQPVPGLPLLDPAQLALGERLFNDKGLSKDGTVACATCHLLQNGGVDRQKSSTGVGGAIGPINAPTVFNSSLNFSQFWNGRSETLEDQAGGPLTAAAEMGNTWPALLEGLRGDPSYVAEFQKAYPDGIAEANVRHAIATFERSLLTPDAPFDRYLRGDPKALSELALAGYQDFVDYGCIACHQGAGVGGNMYQKFGVMGDYFADRGNITEADQGRFLVTAQEADRHVFKVPSLRNVEKTAPYFHDGSAATLEDAIGVMARYQLGRKLEGGDVAELAAFLRSLTGTYQGRSL